ncbi:hypothetical protein [Mycoplasma tauri]|uniref:Uncharacterized protein n=1 Tax=Mycoplasma tauri TaxID=547987 RepID=A0A953NE54_9MOLU|nr:hypothetical protein [Mycoplasma tauri]MBZ4195292.1 hypothetical protein [Mycoplasma tauri]MBZ4218347.1 hypothetical protein [Mycoplasma tauri]
MIPVYLIGFHILNSVDLLAKKRPGGQLFISDNTFKNAKAIFELRDSDRAH